MKTICIREEYTNANGETKVSWNQIGKLIESKGKQYVKLNFIPNVLAHVFEDEKKQKPQTQTQLDIINQETPPF